MAKGDKVVRIKDEHRQPVIIRKHTTQTLKRWVGQLERANCYHEAAALEDDGPGYFWALKNLPAAERDWSGPFATQKEALASAEEFCNS